jgi:pimeloyl-ACP methyl ester carboxylesterase
MSTISSAKQNHHQYGEGAKSATSRRVSALRLLFALPGLLLVAWAGTTGSQTVLAAPASDAASRQIDFNECLVLGPHERAGRSAFHRDPVEFQVVTGAWKAPKAGDTVRWPNGSDSKWEQRKADKDGSFAATAPGGYAYVAVPSAKTEVMLLEASGHGMVYVNGEPRVGDTYGYGYVKLPVLLKAGTNEFLFQFGRGKLKAKLVPPRADFMLNPGDVTLPDLIADHDVGPWGAVVVINATTEPLEDAVLGAAYAGNDSSVTGVSTIPPLSTRKVPFRLQGKPPAKEGDCALKLELAAQTKDGRKGKDSASLTLGVRRPEQTRKCTFASAIDGSVQYYGLVPAKTEEAPGKTKPGLVLTLHGAGVEAIGQAACFAPKTWAHVVAPTNRRPYGFDWEDWGRRDALEVLELTQKQLKTDPQRTYLTGHSMGGHGTWHIGVTFPDRFAAIGPSAGWVSMWSYAGAQRPDHPDPIQEMFLRASAPGDTLALAHNLGQEGVFILHGDKDSNVPVHQARTMRRELGTFHPDLVYFEQPGAEHWWGNACVDWPPMFDFFARHTLPAPEKVQQVDFVTASPGVSARNHWVSIEAQTHPLVLSSVHIHLDREKRSFVGKTDNVARLAIDVGHLAPGKQIEIELDGQKLPTWEWPSAEQRIWLTQTAKKWSLSERPPATLKGPHRYGPFKEAFANRVLLVVGTHGTPEENNWAFSKARYDAETFWYRGNGSMDMVTDDQFEPGKEPNRNIVLYGNADTNSAWKSLLATSPVRVRGGRVQFGERTEAGDDLACLFVRPRAGSDRALVGVVSGTGVAGMRLTDRLPYFMSGVAYPDCMVAGSEVLTKGTVGVRLAGFFGQDWTITTGDFASTKPQQ